MGKWHNYGGSQSIKDRKAVAKLRRDILTAIHKAHTVRCYRDDNGTFKNVVSGFMRLDELSDDVCHDDDGIRIVSDVAFQDAIDWLQKTGRIHADGFMGLTM